ncbi:glycosyltransferase family 2 protein [Flavobacterium humi]|uniref:Glycosyltransferase family 2 protein n=1 Tax=Flavobacterium humi TaxID=2562683 RepID=A0A4Z0L7Y1_9FLAO|nr:glycosyltransferase family 2 protein [Flavobacterium humi]TGD58112.1 glycosyltransferase family 2 protein [Flavobacterium humi]
MPNPQVSVIMPVYNAEKYISETIESILNQTYTDFELLILNDKSTDGSKEIIEKYQAKDSRIILVDKEINVGPARLRNEGFELARAPFVALMDADDIAAPNRFEKQLAYLKNHPDVGVCGTWMTYFGGKKNKAIRHSETHDAIKVSFLYSCAIGNPTVMLRKESLSGLRFDNDYVPVEDYDLWSRLLPKTKFHNIQESLLRYRLHPNNISKTKIENVNRSVKKVKINQLSEFGIESNDPKIESYLGAFEVRRGLQTAEIIEIIEASKYLKTQNGKLRNFNAALLEKQIDKTLLRIIRNAGANNLAFYRQLKKNEGKLFAKMRFLDKAILYLKSVTNWKS